MMTLDSIMTGFVERELLGAFEARVATRLAHRVGENDPMVVLALALAIRAPERGHVMVDLALKRFENQEDPAIQPPTNRVNWCDRVGRSPLVGIDGRAGLLPFQLAGTQLYTDRSWAYQSELALRIKNWIGAPNQDIHDPDLLKQVFSTLWPTSDTQLFSRQALAAFTGILRPFTVLTGGPGTGKTWTVRNLLTLALLNHPAEAPPLRIALAAPTGKAAARMSSALQEGLETGPEHSLSPVVGDTRAQEIGERIRALEPQTLHRLLGWRPDNPTRFRFNAARPLPAELVIVDESSMIDLAMMAKLTRALAPAARLVLVGDPNQLASVEAGSVMADLCRPVHTVKLRRSRAFWDAASGCMQVPPNIEDTDLQRPTLHDHIVPLNRNHRFSTTSAIGRFAQALVANPPDVDTALEAISDADRALTQTHTGEKLSATILNRMVDAYSSYLKLLRSGPQPEESNPAFWKRALQGFERSRVLCAHRQGPLGVFEINRKLSAMLRAPHGPPGEHWLGRPLLITRNDYSTGRFNGDTGLVVSLDGKLVAVFEDPKTDDGVTWLPLSRLPSHTTCFAMTIHRAQGSQWPEVMIVLPAAPSPILTCELVYTGVTRAKEKATIVGDKTILLGALSNPIQRASGLGEMLWGDQASQ